jgi:hypothetical protein
MNQKEPGKIPKEMKKKVKTIIKQFNDEYIQGTDIFYSSRIRGKYLYLDRSDYGQNGPICRLTYTGDFDDWEFAIFRWSSETYDPDAWMFPGSEEADGTIEGAMKAGLKAYPI